MQETGCREKHFPCYYQFYFSHAEFCSCFQVWLEPFKFQVFCKIFSGCHYPSNTVSRCFAQVAFCFPWCSPVLLFLSHSLRQNSPAGCFFRQFKQIVLSSCSVWILSSLRHKKWLPCLLFPLLFLFFLVLPILLTAECHFQHLCFIFPSFSVISNQDCRLLLHLCASFSMVSFFMAFFVSPSSEESQISFSASQFAVYFCCLTYLLSPFLFFFFFCKVTFCFEDT